MNHEDTPVSSVYVFHLNNRHFVFDGHSLLLAEVLEQFAAAVERTQRRNPWGRLEEDEEMRTPQNMHTLSEMHAAGFFVDVDPSIAERAAASVRRNGTTPQRISVLQLLVSGKCNLQCLYCYADQGSFGGESRQPFMALNVLDAALDIVLKDCCNPLFVNCLGGEPLMHPQFTSLVERVVQKCGAKNVNVRLSVSSNGTIFTEKLVRCIIEQRIQLSISLDGSSDVHDTQRPYASGSGSYEKVYRNLERFLERAGQELISVRVTCTRHNLQILVPFLSDLRKCFGRIRVEASPVILESSHPVSLFNDLMPQYVDLRRQLVRNEIEENRATSKLNRDELQEKLRVNRIYQRMRLFAKCELGSSLLTIAPEGDIYPCVAFVGNSSYRLGNVLDAGIEHNEVVSALSEANLVTKRQDCNHCWAKYICAGGCVAVNQTVSGDCNKSTAELCEVYKSAAEASLVGLVAALEYSTSDLSFKDALC